MQHHKGPSEDVRARTGWIRRAVVWAIMLVPSLVFVIPFQSFGELQYNDYYAILNIVVDGTEIKTDLGTWLTLKSNEHTVTFPALVYLANIALTNGDNRGLSAFALLLLLAQFAVLLRLLRPSEGWSQPEKAVVGFVVACFVFTPVITHSVIMGFSGTIWFFSNLCTVLAVAVLALLRGPANVWLATAIGVFGAFVYSTNFSLWPALVVGAWLLRIPWKRLAIIAAGGALILAYNALTYQPLPWHPEPNTSHPALLVAHTLVYLGNVLANEPWAAALAAVVGCGLSAACVALGVVANGRRVPARFVPWIMIQLYVIGNAVGTAVGRSGFGVRQALSSRYGSLTALFWIALLAMMLEILRQHWKTTSRAPAALIGPIAAVAIAVVATVNAGIPTLRGYLDRAGRQPLAAQALYLGLTDPSVLGILTPAPHQIGWVLPFLKEVGHVPFDRSPELPVASLEQDQVEQSLPADLRGNFDGFDLRGAAAARLQGWVQSSGAPIEHVVIADDQGQVRAAMVCGQKRPDVAAAIGRQAERSGWTGFIRRDTKPLRLRAYAKREGDERWFRLPNEHALPAAELTSEGNP